MHYRTKDVDRNRIQLTTMFLLLNVMYMYSSLENFAWCIKCMFIRQVFLCVESKKKKNSDFHFFLHGDTHTPKGIDKVLLWKVMDFCHNFVEQMYIY